MAILAPVPEQDYLRVLAEVGSWQYRVWNQDDVAPELVHFRQPEADQFSRVVAATGATAHDYHFSCMRQDASGQHVAETIVIPRGEQIAVVRFLCLHEGDGDPHFNAYDQIVFPTRRGDVFRMSRRDAPDHYISIADNSRTTSVADAYMLPHNNMGPVQDYGSRGASLQIRIVPAYQTFTGEEDF